MGWVPMLLINIAVGFLDYSLDEFKRMVLLHGLMQVHHVLHHFSIESYRVPHTLLNFKLVVMTSIVVILKKNKYTTVYVNCHHFCKVLREHLIDGILNGAWHCTLSPQELVPNAREDLSLEVLGPLHWENVWKSRFYVWSWSSSLSLHHVLWWRKMDLAQWGRFVVHSNFASDARFNFHGIN